MQHGISFDPRLMFVHNSVPPVSFVSAVSSMPFSILIRPGVSGKCFPVIFLHTRRCIGISENGWKMAHGNVLTMIYDGKCGLVLRNRMNQAQPLLTAKA